MSAEHQRVEKPFEPGKAPSWRGSSRDLVVNSGERLYDGYAFQWNKEPGRTWNTAPNDDWDTEMVTQEEAEAGARFVGHRRIDGTRCAVFEMPDGVTYYAQTAMQANGEVDPRDIPAHLRPAELSEIPEHNGESVRYSQGYPSNQAPGWYQVEYATGSDYSGSSVHRSNYKELVEMLKEAHPEDSQPVVWVRTPGGHSTYGLAVRYGDLDEEIRSALDGLEDYPSINDEALSELEMEEQSEAWDNWGKSEFIKNVAKLEGKDRSALEEAITPDQWWEVFHAMCTSTNRDWEDQGGEGPYIDMAKLAEELTAFVESGKFPQYSQDNEDDALQALYDALPNIEED